jgi:hypothetical protein
MAALGSHDQRPGRQQQHQHEPAVGVAGPVHGDRDRREREKEAGEGARCGARAATDQVHEHCDRGHPFQHLR